MKARPDRLVIAIAESPLEFEFMVRIPIVYLNLFTRVEMISWDDNVSTLRRHHGVTHSAQWHYAVARVRLRVRNMTAFARKPSSLCATGVSLNGIHIYGDTGRNTHSPLRGQRVANRRREKEKEG